MKTNFEDILKILDDEKVRISIVPDLTNKITKEGHVPRFALYIIKGDEKTSFPFNKYTTLTRMMYQIEKGIRMLKLKREIHEGNESIKS